MLINDGTADISWIWLLVPNGLEDFFAAIGRPRSAGEAAPQPFARPADVLEIERRAGFAPPPADPQDSLDQVPPMAEVVVIGAGIVGLSAAYHLHADGHRVTVVDRDLDGDGASSGNAGGIGISEIVPASVPGLIWRVPGWLLDPLGPCRCDPDACPPCCPGCGDSCAPELRRRWSASPAALAALMGNCFDDLVPLLATLGLSADLHRVGALSVYETTAGFVRDRPEWDLKRRHGILAEEITGDQAREREPALGPVVKHAISTPQWAHVSDPKVITDRLLQWLRLHGVAVRRGEALGADGRMLRTVGRRSVAVRRARSSRPVRGRRGSPARSAIAYCWKASVATTPRFPNPASGYGPR